MYIIPIFQFTSDNLIHSLSLTIYHLNFCMSLRFPRGRIFFLLNLFLFLIIQLIQCCEILTIPLHSVESDGDNGGAGTGSTTIVGITEYFSLKDKKG